MVLRIVIWNLADSLTNAAFEEVPGLLAAEELRRLGLAFE